MLLPWRSTCNIYVILKPIQRWTANDSFWRQCLFKKTKALDIRFSSLQAGYEVPDVHILCEDPKVPAGLSPSPKTHTGPNCNLWSTKCCFFKLACVPQKGEPLGFDSSSSQGLFPAFFQSVFSVFQYAPISLSSVLHYFNKLYRGHWRLAPGDRHAVLCHVVRSGTLRPVECPVVGQWAGLLWFSPFPQTMVFLQYVFFQTGAMFEVLKDLHEPEGTETGSKWLRGRLWTTASSSFQRTAWKSLSKNPH